MGTANECWSEQIYLLGQKAQGIGLIDEPQVGAWVHGNAPIQKCPAHSSPSYARPLRTAVDLSREHDGMSTCGDTAGHDCSFAALEMDQTIWAWAGHVLVSPSSSVLFTIHE